MSQFLETYSSYIQERREITASRMILDAVGVAMAPFKVYGVTLYLKEGFGAEVVTLYIKIDNMPWLGEIELYPDSDLMIRYPHDAYVDLAKQAYDYLKAIPQVTPPENCHLGET